MKIPEDSNGRECASSPAVTGATNKAQGNTASLPALTLPPLSEGVTALDAALAYAQAGWFVGPVKAGTKHPGSILGEGWPTKTSRDPEAIPAWFDENPDAGVFLHVGRSGALVFDIDHPEVLPDLLRQAINRDRPPHQRTRRDQKGRGHYLYSLPAGSAFGNSPGGLGAGWGDVRGSNGVIIAAPSTHPDPNGCYSWVQAGALPVLPPELAEALTAATRQASAPVGEAGQQTALAREMAAVLTAKPGERNNRLNEAAYDLGQLVGPGGLEEGLVRAVLTEAGQHCNLDPVEVAATVESGLRSGQDNPRAVAGLDNEPSSWLPVDLAAVLDGTRQPITPTLFPRIDGVCLLYPGLTHSFHGESESGKSMLAQIETARLLGLGEHVLYLDFESDEVSVVERLRLFGASSDVIRELFAYVRPESNPSKTDRDRRAWEALLARRFALAVIDGVTDALGLWNAETESNRDVTGWSRELPKLIADRTGAAVLMVDHVTKNADTRGRFAIGGQAKLSALTGSAYTVAVATGKPLGRGLRGEIVVRVAKDRPGYVRNISGPMTADRTQETARITVDSTGDLPAVSVDAWRATPTNEDGSFRPTSVMERVSKALESAGESLSDSKLKARIEGVRDDIRRQAVEALARDGYIEVTPGSIGKAKLHRSLRPYRQSGDPASDRFAAQGTLA